MTALITFEQEPGSRRTHDAWARLGGGVSLHVAGGVLLDEIELVRHDACSYVSFRVTAAAARALGAELLAAAAAVDAMRGAAAQPVEG